MLPVRHEERPLPAAGARPSSSDMSRRRSRSACTCSRSGCLRCTGTGESPAVDEDLLVELLVEGDLPSETRLCAHRILTSQRRQDSQRGRHTESVNAACPGSLFLLSAACRYRVSAFVSLDARSATGTAGITQEGPPPGPSCVSLGGEDPRLPPPHRGPTRHVSDYCDEGSLHHHPLAVDFTTSRKIGRLYRFGGGRCPAPHRERLREPAL